MVRTIPCSRTSAMRSGFRRMAYGTSLALASGLALLNPMVRSELASDAVNSKYPPPEAICCCDRAPASAQPSHPELFVRELPEAVTFTRLLQTTGWGRLGVGTPMRPGKSWRGSEAPPLEGAPDPAEARPPEGPPGFWTRAKPPPPPGEPPEPPPPPPEGPPEEVPPPPLGGVPPEPPELGAGVGGTPLLTTAVVNTKSGDTAMFAVASFDFTR